MTCESCAHFAHDDSARTLLTKLGRAGSKYGWCNGKGSPHKGRLVPPNHDTCTKFTQKDEPLRGVALIALEEALSDSIRDEPDFPWMQ